MSVIKVLYEDIDDHVCTNGVALYVQCTRILAGWMQFAVTLNPVLTLVPILLVSNLFFDSYHTYSIVLVL